MRRTSSMTLVLVLTIAAVVGLIAYTLAPSWAFIPYLAVVLLPVPYYQTVLRSLKKKQFDLSIPSLITIYLLLALGHPHATLTFIVVLLLGDLFKTVILDRVKRAISEIAANLPRIAMVKRGEKQVETPIGDIQVTDILAVKTGERVAADSALLSDAALLDESVVTGESQPIQKRRGEKLLAGSINLGDYLEAEVTATARNSTLLQIQSLVELAQDAKAPLAQSIHEYAVGTLVIAGVGVGAIWLISHDLLKALSFWIAVVPVIFAILVPVATTIGISAVAKKGIMVKNAAALESLTRVRSLFFDKTGTITTGMPQVEGTLQILPGNEEQLIGEAASLEQYSTHPLGRPILEEARQRQITLTPLEQVKTLTGQGMVAANDGQELFVGNWKLLGEKQVPLEPEARKIVEDWELKGATPVFVGANGQVAGVIFLRDRLKPGVRELLQKLVHQGYHITILTGDKQAVAEAILGHLPGVSVIAEVSPQQKVREIENAVQLERDVVMVGDGINDAPALAQATVGIAMGRGGTDLTLNAADIVLMNNNIESIPVVMTTARLIFRIIRESVLLATGIHLVAAILVLTGTITLIETTYIHQASSVLVLLNTLRLFQVKMDKADDAYHH